MLEKIRAALKKIFADVSIKVIAGVIAGAILTGSVGTYLIGLWPTIAAIASKIISLVVASTLVPNRLLIPICLLAAIGAVRLLKVLYRYIAPDWHDYRQDTFFGIIWRWGYDHGNLVIPMPFCPRCDTQMDQDSKFHYPSNWNRPVYHCGNCDNQISVNDSHDAILKKVILQIGRKIRQMGK